MFKSSILQFPSTIKYFLFHEARDRYEDSRLPSPHVTKQNEPSSQYECGDDYLATGRFITGLTSWLMEPRDSIPHSQGLSSNPSPEPNQTNFLN